MYIYIYTCIDREGHTDVWVHKQRNTKICSCLNQHRYELDTEINLETDKDVKQGMEISIDADADIDNNVKHRCKY